MMNVKAFIDNELDLKSIKIVFIENTLTLETKRTYNLLCLQLNVVQS